MQFEVLIIQHRQIDRGDENSLTLVIDAIITHLRRKVTVSLSPSPAMRIFLFHFIGPSVVCGQSSPSWTPEKAFCSPAGKHPHESGSLSLLLKKNKAWVVYQKACEPDGVLRNILASQRIVLFWTEEWC